VLYEDPVRRANREAATPLRRLGQPVDIAGPALLLASQAGAFITGQILTVDGGTSIQSR
jgi:NAD(P)-dependent dehydrogenase (short-subunit alcohol dehydrogenase family)